MNQSWGQFIKILIQKPRCVQIKFNLMMTVQILGLILQFYSLILKPVSGMLGYLIPHFCQQTHNE